MMVKQIDWLPPLVLLESYSGNWERYINIIYSFYKQDFIENKPIFQNHKLAIKRYPIVEGKEATFWHIISEGKEEADRIPNLRRCERIRWPRPIIEHADDSIIKVWKNQRRNETRICIWLEEQEYLVVLAYRKTYILFLTAYPTTQNHTKRKLQKEYKAFKKARAA